MKRLFEAGLKRIEKWDNVPKKDILTMKKLLIAFASSWEAERSLQLFGCALEEGKELYSIPSGHIVITGYGCLQASSQVSRYAHLADEIWNLGIAGAFHASLEEMQIQAISHCSLNLSFPAALDAHSIALSQKVFPAISLSQEGARLVSSHYPVYEPSTRLALSLSADLVDMEGYGVASAAALLKKPCRLWKLVSDQASPEDWLKIFQNKRHLSLKIAQHLEHLLHLHS
ncbi:MAG: nucleoside phosphorylase [Chlamydiales bacterium]|jgi:adenosylhomocysteine nucleosidase|nr:nucleoside phosphorylase [Chlamydiales bacterium]